MNALKAMRGSPKAKKSSPKAKKASPLRKKPVPGKIACFPTLFELSEVRRGGRGLHRNG
jgi:hypothetical protein